MQDITRTDELEPVFDAPTALLFKHSTRCPISARALGEVEALLERVPDAPVFRVDVNAQQALSQQVAERTGVTHESPQVILLRGGEPEWDASRMEIHAGELIDRLGGGGATA